MGIDMCGWVEIRNRFVPDNHPQRNLDGWNGVILIDDLVDRNLDMFGMLFGVGNFANLPPVAGVRGLPIDISKEASDSYLRWSTFAESWITFGEIQDIDWDIDAVAGRPHIYKYHDDGTLMYHSKCQPMDGDVVEEGNTWVRRSEVWKVERISRRQVLDGDCQLQLVIDLMARLADRYGRDGVRLVVWFDR